MFDMKGFFTNSTGVFKCILCLSIILFFSGYQFNSLAENKINIEKNLNEKEVCILGKNFWIVYDSRCPYCKSAKKYIKQLDWENKFKFLSYRDPLTYQLFPKLNKEECEKDVHMVTPKGEVLVGYHVFRTIIDNLAATKLLNPLLKNDFAEQQLNEIYEKMVKERSCYYNKSDACSLEAKKQKGVETEKEN